MVKCEYKPWIKQSMFKLHGPGTLCCILRQDNSHGGSLQRRVHKLTKEEQGQYPAILTEQARSIKDLLHGFLGNYSCGTRQVVPSQSSSQSQYKI